MKTCMKPWVTMVSLVFAGMLLAQAARAQDLPKGEQIVDKYVEATGGKEAYDKVKSRVASGTIEIPAQNIKGKVVIHQAAPNKVLAESEIPGIMTDQKGTDGHTVWETNTTTGPRILDGVEKTNFMRRHSMDGDSNWRKYYSKAETVGVEKIDGKECFKVELTPKDGAIETQFYDKGTGLVVRMISKEKTPQGEIDVESDMVEYRKIDGLTIPSKIKQKVMNIEVLISLDKVEHNVKIPDDKFKIPEDVKKLVEKSKKSEK